MELDDMKNTWMSLDERLRKQEVLKESIMKELLQTKSDKALSRLIGYELSGVIVLLVIIPVIIYGMTLHLKLPEFAIFMYIMLVVCVVGIIWQASKVYGLMQIDFSKVLSNNILYINKYNIKMKREKLIMLFLIPLLALAVIYLYARLNANTVLWAFMFCGFIGAAVYTYWAYKKLYDKNITSILKSLDELKELEE